MIKKRLRRILKGMGGALETVLSIALLTLEILSIARGCWALALV